MRVVFMKRIVIITLIIMLTAFIFSNQVIAKESVLEEKITRNFSIEENFKDDSVLVVLKNKESQKLLDYNEKSFEKITNCLEVYDLTNETKKLFRMIKNNDYSFIENELDIRNRLSLDNYHQILKIELIYKSKENVLKMIKELSKDDRVLCAEPNFVLHANTVPFDYNSSSNWGLSKIGITSAWDIENNTLFGNYNPNLIRIGVLDSGIDGLHVDLDENIFGYSINNGIITTSSSMDFTSGYEGVSDNPPTTNTDHGTKVAGIIGAIGNKNNNSTVGVCWNTRLISLKVLDNTNNTSPDYLINAIDYATSISIDVLNCSIGVASTFLYSIYSSIQTYPGLFVCSAGNEGSNIDITSFYPGKFVSPNIITVGASNQYDEKCDFSNYGSVTVDLFAPGIDIRTTQPNNQYGNFEGTSAAAPFVTGVAALIMKHYNKSLTPFQVKTLILDNVDVVDNLAGMCVTNGRLNAYKALSNGFEPKTLTGDVNGDGRDDMVLVRNDNGYYKFEVYNGLTTSYFSQTSSNTTTSIPCRADDEVYSGDFNGDNKLDILIHASDGSNRILYVCIGNSTSYFSTNIGMNSCNYYNPIICSCKCIVADQNNDGKDDFVVMYKDINNSNKVSILVYRGKSTSVFIDDAITPCTTSITYKDTFLLFKGDFNGDNKDDLLIHSTRSDSGIKRTLYIFKANSSSTWYDSYVKRDSDRTYYPDVNPSLFYVEDVNNDGKDDFIVCFKQYDYYRYALTYLGTSNNPYLNEASSYSLSSTDSFKIYYQTLMGDINGDGYIDIVAIESNSLDRIRIRMYEGNSSGNFSSRIDYIGTYNFYPSTSTYRCYFSDVNGDGYGDVVIKKEYGNDMIFYTLYGCSSGIFNSVSTFIYQPYYD